VTVFILTKGWFCFIFKSSEDAEEVLKRVWVVSNGNLILEQWTYAFNPEKEHIRFRHLWVLMPSCPVVIWNVEAFKVIGNTLGKFLHDDTRLLIGQDRKMWKLLLEIDLHEGLLENMDIVWRGTVYQ